MKANEKPISTQANFRQAKVLVVEDSDDHWALIQNAMQQVLPEVSLVRVPTPAQALSLFEEWTTQEWELPKLILLDLYLPLNQDGWALLEQIKAMPVPLNQIPVVMFSSSTASADIQQAYQLGASSYLVKPVNFESWLQYFQELRAYWWETAMLPPLQFNI